VTSSISANTLLSGQISSLQQAGWRTAVLCDCTAALPESNDLLCIPMNRGVSPLADVWSTRQIIRTLTKLNPSVVISSTPKAGLLGTVAAKRVRIPIRILDLWGARWDGMSGWRRRLLLASDRIAASAATDVLSVSHSLSELAYRVGISRMPPKVLGQGGSKGVDLEVFFPANRILNERPNRLGFAGRLSTDKGVSDLLQIFALLRLQRPDVTLEVIGDVDLAQPLPVDRVNELAHTRGITWIPHLPPEQLAERMRLWDLLVFPSHREGLPNVVLEAAACGVPAVGWNVTGVRDAIVDGKTGRLVALGNIRAMLAATLECLNPQAHDELRAAAVSRIRAHFSREKIEAQYLNFLEERIRDGQAN
jgi:glycosyltransferase involved in cell wall biosynthesis